MRSKFGLLKKKKNSVREFIAPVATMPALDWPILPGLWDPSFLATAALVIRRTELLHRELQGPNRGGCSSSPGLEIKTGRGTGH
jgi:hypothetical protein